MKLLIPTIVLILLSLGLKAQNSPSIDTTHYLTKPVPTSMRTDTLSNNLLTYNPVTRRAELMSGVTLSSYFRKGLALTSSVPTKTSQLTNDANFLSSLSITAGNGIVITGLGTSGSPYIISVVQPTINNTPGRSLNTNFTIGGKWSIALYSVTASTTNPLLVGSSAGTVNLEYSLNAGSTWNGAFQVGNLSSVGVAVAVQLTNGQTTQITGIIPASALVRLRTTSSGTATITYVGGQENTFW